MRFTDSFLHEVRERVSIADYAGKRLTWAKGKSRPSAGDYWAPCPFHTEKTASFHVRDREGTYKCFGCAAAGNVFKLCMALEGLSFPEAVTSLANQAGIPLPQEDPAEAARQDRRSSLLELAGEADRRYRAALRGPAGAKARAYLEKRGLPEEVWDAFGIGFAPEGWSWLADALIKAGARLSDLEEAGLAKQGQRGAIDTFRNRILFPIADPQGRTIAFGGRAMDPQDPAKYLNSPQCALFDKGRTLYRLKEARALASRMRAAGLVVAEGYLDVIALERAGFPAVAPLGTALTETQLELLWKAGAEPILCFDGDAAGQKAAGRALDLALPFLSPERTLKIAVLPPGQDPDDIYQSQGAEALAQALAGAMPAVDALFEREKKAKPLTTPEAQAGLKARLRKAAETIKDSETGKLYQRALGEKAWALQTTERSARSPNKRGAAPAPPRAASAELKALVGRRRQPEIEDALRLAIDVPRLLPRGEELLAQIEIADAALSAIRDAVLALLTQSLPVDRGAVRTHLLSIGEDRAAARLLLWPPVKTVSSRPGAKLSTLKTGAEAIEDPDAAGAAHPAPAASAGLNEAAFEALASEWEGLLGLAQARHVFSEDLAAVRADGSAEDSAVFARIEALMKARRQAEQDVLARGRTDSSLVRIEPPHPDDQIQPPNGS
jgi:DNA primase